MTSLAKSREGRPGFDGPLEGAPSWMRAGLIRWLVDAYSMPSKKSEVDEVALERLATLLRIDVVVLMATRCS